MKVAWSCETSSIGVQDHTSSQPRGKQWKSWIDQNLFRVRYKFIDVSEEYITTISRVEKEAANLGLLHSEMKAALSTENKGIMLVNIVRGFSQSFQ